MLLLALLVPPLRPLLLLPLHTPAAARATDGASIDAAAAAVVRTAVQQLTADFPN